MKMMVVMTNDYDVDYGVDDNDNDDMIANGPDGRR